MSMTLKKRWTRYRVKWFTKLQNGKTVPPGTEVEYEVWSGGGTPSAYLGSSGDIIHYRMPDDADCFKMGAE